MLKNNIALGKAKIKKNDEFYTRLIDIRQELHYYKEQFKNKIILIPCEINSKSNFGLYFLNNKNNYNWKKVIIVEYHQNEQSIVTEYLNNYDIENDSNNYKIYKLKGNGDFRSQEVIELYKEVDIIVTNPPFSLFREFISQLINLDKKFLIVGCKNALTYKDIFKLFQNNQIRLGYNNITEFEVIASENLSSTNKKFGNIGWFTNLNINYREKILNYTKKYELGKYEKYSNYDAINIDKIKDIPKNYFEPMGVPITFLEYYNPNEFKIIKFRKGDDNKDLRIKNKSLYCRIIIQRLIKTNIQQQGRN